MWYFRKNKKIIAKHVTVISMKKNKNLNSESSSWSWVLDRHLYNLIYFFSQLDVLEYIHENEYVHGDIKAANLLLGYKNPDRVNAILNFAFKRNPHSAILRYSKKQTPNPDGFTNEDLTWWML